MIKIFLVSIMLLLTVSCGNKPLIQNNVTYNCYGFMDKDEEKKSNVQYELEMTNMLGTLLLSETLFVPVWNLGWNTYCPVKLLKE